MGGGQSAEYQCQIFGKVAFEFVSQDFNSCLFVCFVLTRWFTRRFCMFVISSDCDGAQYDVVSLAAYRLVIRVPHSFLTS